MVVPRSAQTIDSDDDFTLYAVTTFKRHSVEFIHKCRESKWTPRDYKYQEGGREAEQQEVERVGKEERKVWGEALRLGRTAWGEAVITRVHVLALRVFVETVLRYGLPLSFVCGLIQVCEGWRDEILRFFLYSQGPTLNSMNRQPPNSRSELELRWTAHIPIWAGTPLDEIRRVESPRTIPRPRRRCRQRGTWGMTTMRHMSATSLRSDSGSLIHPINRTAESDVPRTQFLQTLPPHIP